MSITVTIFGRDEETGLRVVWDVLPFLPTTTIAAIGRELAEWYPDVKLSDVEWKEEN